jgi:hypothetical protein
MDRLDIPAGSFALGRRAARFRPLTLGQEEAAAELPAEPGREQSLAGYIPSALISTEARMAALAIGGAPAWSRRLRRIDTLVDEALTELEAVWRQLAQAWRNKPTAFAAEWRDYAAQVNFTRVNDLIRRHNLYFPAEANLAMDVHTGDFIGLGGGDYRRRPLDAAWVLERFPADLASALE